MKKLLLLKDENEIAEFISKEIDMSIFYDMQLGENASEKCENINDFFKLFMKVISVKLSDRQKRFENQRESEEFRKFDELSGLCYGTKNWAYIKFTEGEDLFKRLLLEDQKFVHAVKQDMFMLIYITCCYWLDQDMEKELDSREEPTNLEKYSFVPKVEYDKIYIKYPLYLEELSRQMIKEPSNWRKNPQKFHSRELAPDVLVDYQFKHLNKEERYLYRLMRGISISFEMWDKLDLRRQEDLTILKNFCEIGGDNLRQYLVDCWLGHVESIDKNLLSVSDSVGKGLNYGFYELCWLFLKILVGIEPLKNLKPDEQKIIWLRELHGLKRMLEEGGEPSCPMNVLKRHGAGNLVEDSDAAKRFADTLGEERSKDFKKFILVQRKCLQYIQEAYTESVVNIKHFYWNDSLKFQIL